MSDDPELLLAAGDVAAAGGGAAAAVVFRAGRLGERVLIALLTVPVHALTSRPVTAAAAGGTTRPARRRGPRPPADRFA